ncbi:MAG: ABC transporter substrate-binding protein [Hyphomicrobium aestuarii]|nr:ABC transporter substrate-binding protein [Hyphomicrobium aestuarii]
MHGSTIGTAVVTTTAHKLLKSIALAVTVALAAGNIGNEARAAEPIRIGFPMILSGPGAQFGSQILKGAEMYVAEVNAKGGVLGRKYELVPRDTKSRPDEAVRVARELVTRENVDFIVGTFTSGEGPAVSEIAKENKTVFLALGPKTDRLTAPDALHPYVFRISANTTTEGRAAAAIMAQWSTVKRVATIAPDFAYGRDASASFVAHLKKLRPDIEIVDQQWPKLNEVDYSPFVTAQMGSRPDAVFSVVCCGNFDTFAKQAGPLGYFKRLDGRFIGVAEAGSIEALRSLGSEYPTGIWGNTYDAFNWKPQDAAIAAAHADYTARLAKFTGQTPPSSWPIQGYLGMHVLTEAIKAANSIKADDVSKALKGLKIETPQGPMTMRPNDQQLTRGMVWGRPTMTPGQPFPLLEAAVYVDASPLMD